MRNAEEQRRYERAKKKVQEEKGFYGHLTAYIIVNVFLLFINLDFSSRDYTDWSGWSILITPVLWGIGLFFHWIGVFGKNPFFSKNWEERKIKEIMEEEDDFLK
ncbi:2TM domain-containing protein [Aquimarina sp. 2201CG5-10]|uniref:2TM domain-containing protein n=1 Tax=Aquimarina callyspongiae TaxID=3098150 RepID=UPI002AB5A18F|nr:2TM domain-containing protein [Aquimarina sp. 2201CG5-10]MDY8137389.1 2TM domain-containing protein [Aquimarina sp. 2201CG5-10]